MSRRPRASVAAICIAGAIALACSGGGDAVAPTPSPVVTLPTFAHVVLISIDGMRGDALSHTTTIAGLAQRGVWTDSMHTVIPSMTVPGHYSMLTGRDVTTFGLRDNTFNAGTGITLALHAASSVFDWAKGAGRNSKAVAGAILIPASSRAQAQDFFVLDTLAVADLDADSVTAQAIQIVTGSTPPSILFIHYSDVDLTGHDHGWLAPSTPGGAETLNPVWLAAVAHVDAAIGKLLTVLQTSIEVGSTAVIVTADHGGGDGVGGVAGDPPERQHCTSSLGDIDILFVLIGKGLAPKRLPSGLRITQVAATVAKLLGVTPPATADVAVSD